MNGVAYGEPYESAVAQMTVQGQDIEASHVVLKAAWGADHGQWRLRPGNEHLHGHVEGHKLQLSKFKTVQKANTEPDGVLSLVADANGTMKEPQLKANCKACERDD